MRPSLPSRLALCLLASLCCLAIPSAEGGCPATGACHFPRWIPAEAAALEQLGTAIAFDGAHAALAAPGGEAVYVYRRVGKAWIQQQRLDAPASSGGGFGASIALFEHRLVIGDPSDSTLGASAGAAHVYLDAGGSWAYTQLLLDPAGLAGDLLGCSVAVTDTWVVTGASGDSDGGRVHLFLEAAGWTWSTSIRDFATGTVPEAFGASVAMRDQWLLIGDPLSDTHAPDTGALFTFEQYEAIGFFQDLTIPPSLEAGDMFAGSIAFDDERIVVGASGDDEMGDEAGAAYVFAFTELEVEGHEVNLVEQLVQCGPGPGHRFGTTVSVRGNRVAVGVPGKDPVGRPGGRVQVFSREPGVFPEAWTFEVEVAPDDGAPGDLFGSSVGLAGNHMLVGSPGVDAVGSQSGAAYLVSLASSSVPGGRCPCDDLATLIEFGGVKRSATRSPRLTLDCAPVPGEATTISLTSALPGATPLLLWGTTAAMAGFDVGQWVGPGLNATRMPAVDAGGSSELIWNVRPMHALCGSSLVLQSVILDPKSSGQPNASRSNGVQATVGY